MMHKKVKDVITTTSCRKNESVRDVAAFPEAGR
jgi:hypothetical protein